MSTREIEAHLLEMYGAEVSPALISSITDAVNDEIKLWQSRPPDSCYAIVYLDCLMLKVRDSGSVSSRAVYLAVGVNLDGMKEVLGIWTAQTEGAKFWLAVITELKNRGVADILIACVARRTRQLVGDRITIDPAAVLLAHISSSKRFTITFKTRPTWVGRCCKPNAPPRCRCQRR